ncbi:SDR family NAD(P)-dependent oxidoreductase [Roseomonas sp. 18066]|uniref:SDR family NAD(P)-dependent oxidoreductase n=1 Tax=Roseomonas sp. 18066 TaxID=2681412 RepID=UPI001356B386|nr:SDR family NAD(P)-dependent oxidoreductase [Roseomonas sp. 18066]
MDFAQDLRGKRVVVTGACGVIGRWIVDSFLSVGAVVCATDGNAAALDALAGEVALGEGGFAFAGDLRDAASIDALAAEIGRRWGAAEILVNNAGVYPSGFLLDIDAAEWDRVFDINLRAPFLLTRAIAKQMVAGGVKGSIVNISSGASRKMRRSVVPYCVSKTALERLTKGFALELAEYGIRVNALEPGFAPGSTASPLTDAHVANTTAGIPLGRGTSADDIGNALFYLVSSAGAYVTGSTLSVDGGNSIGTMAVYQDKKSAL